MDARALGPITKGPWIQRVTDTTAVIRVEVNPPSPVTVELQLGPTDGGRPAVTSAEAVPLHAVTLEDLEPGKRYAFSIRAGASTKFGSFVTAPAPDSDASFRFMAYGDNRTDDAAHASVVRAMVSNPSEFLVHTGDFVSRGGSPTQWQNFFDIEAPLLSTRAHFSAVGNHELTDGPGIEYARYFGPTEIPNEPPRSKWLPAATKPAQLDGTFRWGSARFFLINGMVSYKATEDRAWLDKAFADADAEPGIVWRIVVVHHGPWSSGPHGGNQRLRDAGVIEAMKQHKVDLVISGHDHIYERGWSEGIAFIISGGGGAPLYNVKKPIPESRKVEAAHHFVDVSVSRSSLQVVAMRADGSTLDRCGLSKSGTGWDCDGVSGEGGAAASSGGARGAPGASGSPIPRCGCDAVGLKSSPRTWTAGLALPLLWGLRRRKRPSTTS